MADHETPSVATSPWKAYCDLGLKPFFAVHATLKGIFPDKFFVVEEGITDRNLNFSTIQFIAVDESEAERWAEGYAQRKGIVRVDKHCFSYRNGGCQKRNEKRYWTRVYAHEGAKTGPLGEKTITVGSYVCVAEMSLAELAMRMSQA